MKEMFTSTGVVIQADEPIISFKGPFYADFSNLLANTSTRVLGKLYCLHHSLQVYSIIGAQVPHGLQQKFYNSAAVSTSVKESLVATPHILLL